MIVVIQCAARKAADAGHLRTHDGRNVMFVANPDLAPPDDECIYARPDDVAETGTSWRTVLRQYNENPRDNRLGLLPAWRLYRNPTYEILAERCGLDRLYILSAGWGLIPANLLTPNYDITFSAAQNVQKFKRRRRHDTYRDFRMLPANTSEPILFFRWQGLYSAVLQADGGFSKSTNGVLTLEGSQPHRVAGSSRLESHIPTGTTSVRWPTSKRILNSLSGKGAGCGIDTSAT